MFLFSFCTPFHLLSSECRFAFIFRFSLPFRSVTRVGDFVSGGRGDFHTVTDLFQFDSSCSNTYGDFNMYSECLRNLQASISQYCFYYFLYTGQNYRVRQFYARQEIEATSGVLTLFSTKSRR